MAPQTEALTNGSAEDTVKEEESSEDYDVEDDAAQASVSFRSLYGCASAGQQIKMEPFPEEKPNMRTGIAAA